MGNLLLRFAYGEEKEEEMRPAVTEVPPPTEVNKAASNSDEEDKREDDEKLILFHHPGDFSLRACRNKWKRPLRVKKTLEERLKKRYRTKQYRWNKRQSRQVTFSSPLSSS